MLTESLVGAALVLLRLVGQNTSVARAIVMAVHLVNTSFLTAAIALTAWTAREPLSRSLRPVRPLDWTILSTLGATLCVSITGAITALGDTLYPVQTSDPLATRIAADHAATASFLERGRAAHPAVALTTALFVLAVCWKLPDLRTSERVESWARAASGLVLVQVGAGVTNIVLSAPGYLQVIHLGIATSVWLALVILYATVVTTPAPVAK